TSCPLSNCLLFSSIRVIRFEVGPPILRMHCSAICLRVTRFTLPWPARQVLLLVFYPSVSFMGRSSCSLHTRNALILPAAGGAPSSLLQDRRHNSIEQSSRKKAIMDNEATHQLPATQPDPRVQLAFERTFLAYERTRIAWVRTAL